MCKNLQSDGSPRGGAPTFYFYVYFVYTQQNYHGFGGQEKLIGVFSTKEKAETVKGMLIENQSKVMSDVNYGIYIIQTPVF